MKTLRWAYDQAWLVLIVTTMLWGGNGVASRLAVGRVTPMSLVFIRWLAVCTMLAIALHRPIRAHWPEIYANRWRILLMAGFGFTGFTVLFYASAYWTTAVNITLLQASIPPMVIGFSVVLRGLKPTMQQLVGMAITLVGVAIIATKGAPLQIFETRFNFGDILVLIACVFYAGYTLALRDRPPLPQLVFFASLAFAALVTSTPFMIGEVALGKFHWPTTQGWLVLIFVALGPSLASQLLFMRGVELIGPNRAGLFSNLVPIFGALFAVALLGEEFHLYHAIALALTLAGIWLAEQRAG
ncbi:MAG: DMT family transporter [Hyphomicrobiales bacterium]|nr:DMT family transporter [Hyphomicrobiales bacterium]